MIKKIMIIWLGVLTAILLISFPLYQLQGQEMPCMTLEYDKNSYQEGDLVTMKICIYQVTCNVAGFSLSYNTDQMDLVDGDGNISEDAGKVVIPKNLYDGKNGYFSLLSSNLDIENGYVDSILFVDPSVGTEITAGEEGIELGSISFKMKEDGAPDIHFSHNPVSVDFYNTGCLILKEGEQVLTAASYVIQQGEVIEETDVSRSTLANSNLQREKSSVTEDEAEQEAIALEAQKENAQIEKDQAQNPQYAADQVPDLEEDSAVRYSTDTVEADEVIEESSHTIQNMTGTAVGIVIALIFVIMGLNIWKKRGKKS